MDSILLDPDREPTAEEIQLGVLEHIEVVIKNEMAELEGAFRTRPVNAVAWISRNLVELAVWTRYYTHSPANARRFYDDAARDALDALKLPDFFSDDPDFSFENARSTIIDEGKAKGIDDLDSAYQRVSDAAKDMGSPKTFRGNNKILSKFAHPTALYVMTPLEELEKFRSLLKSGGIVNGEGALALISEFRSAAELSTSVISD
jgi:hypothetical protein